MPVLETEEEGRAYCAARCSTESLTKLELFGELLAEENTRQNLIARDSLKTIWVRHFADSIQLLTHVPRETTGPWLDLGTGAGLPGLVIAIARPDMSVILVENRRKRIEWLQNVTAGIGLQNVTIEGKKVEAVASMAATVISARAFAPLPKLLQLSTRFSTDATYWVLPKGRSAVQELETEEQAGLHGMFHVERSVTDADARILVGRGRPSYL